MRGTSGAACKGIEKQGIKKATDKKRNEGSSELYSVTDFATRTALVNSKLEQLIGHI